MSGPNLRDAIGLPFPATLPADARLSAQVEARVLALFDECGPGLRRYVSSFNLGGAVSEDVVQEVFLALFRHLSLDRPDTNLKGWLFQVAHNLALKQRQRTIRRGAIETAWDDGAVDRVHDMGSNPEEQLSERRRQQQLSAALRTLPERDRRCLHLRAEGLCYRDIARTLGVSLGSVAKSVVRAVTRLTAAGTE